jgi:hypothetical protein
MQRTWFLLPIVPDSTYLQASSSADRSTSCRTRLDGSLVKVERKNVSTPFANYDNCHRRTLVFKQSGS